MSQVFMMATEMRKFVITSEGKPLTMVTCAVPPTPDQGVRVRIQSAGVCHSDLHFQDGEVQLMGDQKQMTRNVLGDLYEGSTVGHEIGGVVEDLGLAVQSGFKVGDRVVIYPWPACGDCPNCNKGYSNLCEFLRQTKKFDIGLGSVYGGGYATHIVLPKTDFLVKLPDTISMELGCMLPCSGLTAFCALKKTKESLEHGMKVRGKASILIVGAGGLGLWAMKMSKAMFPGIKLETVVADISEEKLEFAKENGADRTVLWGRGQEDVMPNAAKTTMNEENCVDAAIDFVGTTLTTTAATMSMHNGGTIVLIGIGGGAYAFPIVALAMKCYTIKGSKTGSYKDLQEVVEFVASNNITYPNIDKCNLSEANVALNKLRDGKIKGRCILINMDKMI